MIEFVVDGWYTEEELRLHGIEQATLAAARKAGTLRSRKVGREWWYKGAWLLAWLEASG